MKKILLSAVIFAFFTGISFAHDDHNIKIDGPGMRPKIEIEDDVYMYEKHDDIIIENEDFDEEVVISSEGELFINGDKIRVSRKERELLKEYHELATATFDEAADLAEEGVKVGLQGAELGIKAATGVFKILLPGYTAEDYERDVEKEAEKVEKKAEKLEVKAEGMEKMIDHIEDIHEELRESVDELDDLGWF